MGDEGKFCYYCMKRDEKLFAVKDWTGNGFTGYYCQEHYYEVKAFQEKQKQRFLKYFEGLPEVQKEDIKRIKNRFKR